MIFGSHFVPDSVCTDVIEVDTYACAVAYFILVRYAHTDIAINTNIKYG